MKPNTLLHRQIHPDFINAINGDVSSSSFIPVKGHKGRLSVFNGDLIAARDAWRAHISRGRQSDGVLSVTSAECAAQELTAADDPLPDFPEHAIIIFDTKWTKSEVRHRAKALRDYALKRGWQYPP